MKCEQLKILSMLVIDIQQLRIYSKYCMCVYTTACIGISGPILRWKNNIIMQFQFKMRMIAIRPVLMYKLWTIKDCVH